MKFFIIIKLLGRIKKFNRVKSFGIELLVGLVGLGVVETVCNFWIRGISIGFDFRGGNIETVFVVYNLKAI